MFVLLYFRALVAEYNLFISHQVEYLLKWIGYPEDENTWEPVDNLDCPDLISKYEDENCAKTAPAVAASSSSKDRCDGDVIDGGISRKKNGSVDLKVEEETSEDIGPVGFDRGLEPEEILGATEEDGQILFLMKW